MLGRQGDPSVAGGDFGQVAPAVMVLFDEPGAPPRVQQAQRQRQSSGVELRDLNP